MKAKVITLMAAMILTSGYASASEPKSELKGIVCSTPTAVNQFAVRGFTDYTIEGNMVTITTSTGTVHYFVPPGAACVVLSLKDLIKHEQEREEQRQESDPVQSNTYANAEWS